MLDSKTISRIIQTALAEDRVGHDITTNALIDKRQTSEAYIISRQDAVICGTAIVKEIFKITGNKVRAFAYHKDGAKIRKNEPVIFLKGNTRAILSDERVALNFLGHLSGIATLTSKFVEAVKPYHAKVFDTRKTTPGLRDLEKYAVRCGGGENHRRDLSDMGLIKDNHLSSLKDLSLADVIKIARRKTQKRVEIEVETLEQLKHVLPVKPDIILLDNMTPAQIQKAVLLKRKFKSRCLLEASGGITLKNIKQFAKTGVNRISVGTMTHSAAAINFSLEMVR